MKELFHTFDFKDGAIISQGQIDEYRDEILKYFEDNPEAESRRISIGRMIIIGFNYDDAIEIIVSNDYKSFQYS